MADNDNKVEFTLSVAPASIANLFTLIQDTVKKATAEAVIPIDFGISTGSLVTLIENVRNAVREAAGEAKIDVGFNVDGTAATAKAAVASIGEAAQTSTAQSTALGHDLTHTLEIIGNSASRLKGGLQEISNVLHGLVESAGKEAEANETALTRLKNVLGDDAEQAQAFVEKMALANKTLTAAQIAGATTEFYNFGKSVGFSGDKALETSEQFTQLAQDLARINGKDFEAVVDQLAHGFLRGGNGAADLGVRVKESQVAIEAQRLSLTGATEGFTQEELAVARTNLIMAQTADIHARAANVVQTFAEKEKVLKAELAETFASIGKVANQLAGPYLDILIKTVAYVKAFAEAHPNAVKALVVFSGALTIIIAGLTAFAVAAEVVTSVVAGIAGIGTILSFIGAAGTAAATGTAAAAGGFTILGTVGAIASGILASIIPILTVAIPLLLAYGAAQLVISKVIAPLERTKEGYDQLANSRARAAQAGVSSAEADEIEAETKKTLAGATKEVINAQIARKLGAAADEATIRSHSKTDAEATERILRYNEALSEGATDAEAFAQAFQLVARAKALVDISKTPGKSLDADQKKELADIAAQLNDQQRLQAGIITQKEIEVKKEESIAEIKKRRTATEEALKTTAKEAEGQLEKRLEIEAKETENLNTRLILERNIIATKGTNEKRETLQKIGDEHGTTDEGKAVIAAIDAKTAEELLQKTDEFGAAARKQQKEDEKKQDAEVLASKREVVKSGQALEIEALRAKGDAAGAAQLEISNSLEDEKQKILDNAATEHKALESRGADITEYAALKKTTDQQIADAEIKAANEREKARIAENKKREDALKSVTHNAEEAEISLQEARAKGKDSVEGEIEALRLREAEELKQAKERNAEVAELDQIKRKFHADEIKLIEAAALAEEKAAKKKAEEGKKAIGELLTNEIDARDKRQGKGAEVAVRQQAAKLDKDLANIHDGKDASDFKKASDLALDNTLADQKKDVDKLREEAQKASDDFADKTKHHGFKNSKERQKAQSEVDEKTGAANTATDEFNTASAQAEDKKKDLREKADKAALKAAQDEQERQRKVAQEKEDAGGDIAKAGEPGAASGPFDKVGDALKGGLDGLSKSLGDISTSANNLLANIHIFPDITNAITLLTTAENKFTDELTSFGSTVVQTLTTQAGKIDALTASVKGHTAKLNALGGDPNKTAKDTGGDQAQEAAASGFSAAEY